MQKIKELTHKNKWTYQNIHGTKWFCKIMLVTAFVIDKLFIRMF